MSNYPMVDEVNRLVGNLLAAGSGVFLPGVGSLFVERRGARRLSKRSVQPPCRVVSFSSQQQGYRLPMNWHVRCTATLPELRMFTTAGFPARARATC